MKKTWLESFYDSSKKVFKEESITLYKDGDGYSLIGKYSTNFKKRMGTGANGKQVPYFKFYFDKEKIIDNIYVPLVINAALTTAVDENDEIRYMLNDSTVKRFKPIDIVSKDEFYISTKNGKVYLKKRKMFEEIELADVYDRIYEVHTSDINSLKGFATRIRILFLRRLPTKVLELISWIFGWFVWALKGKRYKYDVIAVRFLNKSQDVKQVDHTTEAAHNINFFGYKVSIWTLFGYSLVTVLISILGKNEIVNLLPLSSSISGIVIIALAIISIVLYDKLLPLLFQTIVKYSAEINYNLKYKSLKLKI